jgi:hypothetical protein
MALNFKLSKFIIFLTFLTFYVDWPGVSQVCCESLDKQLPTNYFNHLKRLEEEIERRAM